ncbi:signal transduction histidine kinase [Leptolyngbya sp. Heron Island J]|uniref:hybrid sensor histidine kinase/response regulator n=1 Tax=Leptolyngbya sp. Heron Island J TaxID=1385935 RepID=UPI0003B9CF59|nr:response regulator [Leptolyngbya sp. Heron Island J]ESA34926.1 signal transduction histidine kinase [Leptolyngbya sp. Heron Island J]
MSHEADREVWLNFLDEVDEYLNTIESVLLGLAETGVNPQQMDAALRAVHTIKGIGSMIECPSMSQVAHQFEDSLKIIRVRRGSVEMDAALEILLLQGLDTMRQISSLHRQALPITEAWLKEQAYPNFEKLRERLGEVQASDELALLAEESDDSTAAVMFGTEVDELLERLTSVLTTPGSPCLREELEMMVEELNDLGKMLQLDAFCELCASIDQQLRAATPDQVEPIAHQALELWQRSQALVMVGKLDKIPTQLEPVDIADVSKLFENEQLEFMGSESFVTAEDSEFKTLDLDTEAFSNLNFIHDSDVVEAEETVEADAVETVDVSEKIDFDQVAFVETLDTDPSTTASASLDEAIAAEIYEEQDTLVTPSDAVADDVHEFDMAGIEAAIESFNPSDAVADDVHEFDMAGIEAAIESFNPTEFYFDDASVAIEEDINSSIEVNETVVEPQTNLVSPAQSSTAADDDFVEILVEPVESPTVNAQDPQENTVRVPIKLLTQLNDLFGELIIQRNTINSRLDQMEDLINLFSKRMVSLDKTNVELQTFCDQLAVDTPVSRMGSINGAEARQIELLVSQVATNVAPSWQETTNAPAIADPLTASEQTFDSLELDRYSDLHLLSQSQRETLVQLREVSSDVKLNMREIKQASSNLNRTAKSLQINVTRARMRPLSDIVERFPRTVRELSLQYGKAVELKISGGATLIDRFVAVHLRDPLMHLLRNAFDHGIEDAETRQLQGKSPQGTIEIRATHRGNQTLISISDDGAGINLTKIRSRAHQMGLTEDLLNSMSQSELLGMIFEPGFSTASQVTSLSGRGIGMDVVRTSLEQIRSEVKVDTQPGVGTTFTISVPFTLSIMRVLLVETSGMQLAFPTDSIEEMIRLKTTQIFDTPEQKVINWEGLTVPLIYLDRWLEFRCPMRPTNREAVPIINEPSILIVNQGERLSGIHIDRFWGEREVVIRQIENVISLPPGFNGCTILEDGHVVPLADAVKLLEWVERDETEQDDNNSRPHWQNLLQSGLGETEPPQPLALPQVQQINILVIDDSINMRRLLRTTLEQAGYSVEQGKDGQDAVDQLSRGLIVDAIVCDIEMPRLDGYGVLAELKSDARFKNLPIIMLTSRGSEKHRQLAMRLGATAYITKPYQDHELLQIIEQVL